MALQLRVPLNPTSTIQSPPSWRLKYGTISQTDDNRPVSKISRGLTGGGNRIVKVRSSIDTAFPTVGQVTEVDKDTFWPLVKASGDKTVVLDMYTQWCGPCKIIAPKFKELSEKHLDVVFMKLDCNNENRALAKELGIRVVPTFKILKNSKVVKEVTGAKLDDLVAAIEIVRSSS
ncbi:thioredoxin F2, chloroplastic-like isoform X2 [Impatiens glandulifera]|uniref:thioredoxin F2, chloroplastic-like isoform X1 n=1 Tax=Impatiens glandulifera TaxID=253017 RepID=UPI001FB08771|nr:thioredoxin F2, chloroplastic-like isoform X1 [Impatiens glandulifera]XP_047316272.1 thioredoxin F2, chloroplastic-like isoform X2 [Impatiens glandulifera]